MRPPLCINTKDKSKDSKGMKCFVTTLLNALLLFEISKIQLPAALTDSPGVGHKAAV